MDQPSHDGINTYIISQAIREHGVPVALSGLGGDELFAGYGSFQRALRVRHLRLVPQPLRQAISAAGRVALNGSVMRSKFWDLLASDGSPEVACESFRSMFLGYEIARLTGSKGTPKASTRRPGADVVNEVSRCEFGGYLANTLLRDSDYMSMAHALEMRVPFVDRRLVEAVMRYPGDLKVGGGMPKPLLLKALGDLVPEQVWRRRKMGFTLPFRRWMLAGLRPEIERTLAPGGTLQRMGFNQAGVERVWNGFQHSQDKERWPRTWTLFALARWCEQNDLIL
jgi:asparagine synthase (glutamine-hydrolysing)